MAGFRGKTRHLRRTVGAYVVVVKVSVMPRAQQDQVRELRAPAVLVRDEVMGFELARRSARGVLTVQ